MRRHPSAHAQISKTFEFGSHVRLKKTDFWSAGLRDSPCTSVATSISTTVALLDVAAGQTENPVTVLVLRVCTLIHELVGNMLSFSQ